MIFVGIDPGKTGAIAVLRHDGVIIGVTKMPTTPKDVWDEIWGIHHDSIEEKAFIYIEKVGAMPKQGIASTAKFMRGYGILIGCLAASGIPYDFVAPGVWQKAMGCLTGGNKNISKAKAQQLFPDQKITHVNADALLIAEYGRRHVLSLFGHEKEKQ